MSQPTYPPNPLLIQSGNVTPGHALVVATNGVVQDAGSAGNGLLKTVGLIGTGTNFTLQNALTTDPNTQLGLGIDASGVCTISVASFNGASGGSLQYVINGVTYSFPGSGSGDVAGPLSSIDTDLAAFNGTTGKLIKDSGILTANVVQNIGSTVTSGNLAEFSGTSGREIIDGGLPLTSVTSSILNIADLRLATTSTLTQNQCVVLGYYAGADGGGGVFWYNSADTTSADNGVTIIVDASERRWYREYSGSVNVKWAGADSTGSTDATTAFNAAASAGNGAPILIPGPGTYLIGTATNAAMWMLEAGVIITGLPTINGMVDTSNLSGRIYYTQADGSTGYKNIRVGNPSSWPETAWYSYTISIAEFAVVSRTGGNAVLGVSRTSDDQNASAQGCVGGAFGVLNDWTGGLEPAWGISVSNKRNASTGQILNEISHESLDAPSNLDPYTTGTSLSVNLWLSSGHGNASSYSQSAAAALQPNPKGFERGIVVHSGALDETANPLGIKEFAALPTTAYITWYNAGSNIIARLNDQVLTQAALTTGSFPNYNGYAERTGSTPTQGGDIIYAASFYGNTIASAVKGAYSEVIQQTNFSTGTARFTYQINSMNAGGGYTTVALGQNANAEFTPGVDNAISLGDSTLRWSVVYAATGTINTSDERQKTDIATLSSGLDFINALRPVSYKWKIGANEIVGGIYHDKDGNECPADHPDAKFIRNVLKERPGKRDHFGFIAQEVHAAIQTTSPGIDYAGWVLADPSDPTSSQGLRYDQFIAPLVRAVQELSAKVNALEENAKKNQI